MPNTASSCSTHAAPRQRGFGAVMMIAFILLVGAASLGLTIYKPRGPAAVDDRSTAEALAVAKTALIGYAVRRGGPTGLARPGELPCPDMNNDGLEAATCSPGALGRLPWRTLGIPEPKDSAGETLWYAVAGPLRTQPSNTGEVNSNTRGNLTVRAADGTGVVTTQAAAVIFSAGQSLGAQNRNPAQSAACATTGTTIARNLCAVNYLETANGINNATVNGPFIAGVPSNVFNDRVLYVLVDDYLPAVEMRVGSELRDILTAYRENSVCGCYPWADSWAYSGGIADVGTNRGRFPTRPYPENWGQGSIPLLPEWVEANDWQNQVFYSVARRETDGGGPACLYCSASLTLTVDSDAVSALLFTPGPAPSGIDRSTSANRDRLDYYLDDSQNNDKATCPGSSTENSNTILTIPSPLVPATCDMYVRPASSAMARDRLFIVSTPQCVPPAQAIIKEVFIGPCGPGGSPIRAACQTLVDSLATCSCAAAAQAMVTTPCRNSLNPGQCQSALNQLLTCGY